MRMCGYSGELHGTWEAASKAPGPCCLPGAGWVGAAGPRYLFSWPQSRTGSPTAQSAVHLSLVRQEAQGWTPHQYHQAQGTWRAPGTPDFCQLIGFGEAADLLSTEWLLWTWNPACRSSLINLGRASWLILLQTACLREAGWWLDNLLRERDFKANEITSDALDNTEGAEFCVASTSTVTNTLEMVPKGNKTMELFIKRALFKYIPEFLCIKLKHHVLNNRATLIYAGIGEKEQKSVVWRLVGKNSTSNRVLYGGGLPSPLTMLSLDF